MSSPPTAGGSVVVYGRPDGSYELIYRAGANGEIRISRCH